MCQPTHCGRKTNEPSSVAWWPLCQPTGCGRSNAAWWPLCCGLKRNELSRGARWPLSQLNCITNSAVLVTNKVKLAVYQNVTILSVAKWYTKSFRVFDNWIFMLFAYVNTYLLRFHLHKHCFRDHCLFLKKPKGVRDILKQIVQRTKFKVWYRKVDLSVATCKYDFN